MRFIELVSQNYRTLLRDFRTLFSNSEKGGKSMWLGGDRPPTHTPTPCSLQLTHSLTRSPLPLSLTGGQRFLRLSLPPSLPCVNPVSLPPSPSLPPPSLPPSLRRRSLTHVQSTDSQGGHRLCVSKVATFGAATNCCRCSAY